MRFRTVRSGLVSTRKKHTKAPPSILGAISCFAVLVILLAPGSTLLVAQSRSPGASLPPESRQFDFWVGTWDVNLRIREEDGTWPDHSVRADARIYPILDGKAVLELWDSEPIVGMSLRYYDTTLSRWVLWLNWPGPNGSGSTALEGVFRHGRAEFSGRRPGPEGSEVISRFTFSDIAADRLRWDDAYSRDDGMTWSHHWIMEFSRTGQEPELPSAGGPAHTFRGGDRCGSEPYRVFESLAGRRQGTVERKTESGGWESTDAVLTGWKILGGCAVAARLEAPAFERRSTSIHLFTWNTYAGAFEESWLDDWPDSRLQVAYGRKTDSTVQLSVSDRRFPGSPPRSRIWSRSEDGIEMTMTVDPVEGTAEPVERWSFPE